MAVSKERVQQISEEMGYKFHPFTNEEWVRIEKNEMMWKFKSYDQLYQYLYRLRRKQ